MKIILSGKINGWKKKRKNVNFLKNKLHCSMAYEYKNWEEWKEEREVLIEKKVKATVRKIFDSDIWQPWTPNGESVENWNNQRVVILLHPAHIEGGEEKEPEAQSSFFLFWTAWLQSQSQRTDPSVPIPKYPCLGFGLSRNGVG
jgi:hypothetical protein